MVERACSRTVMGRRQRDRKATDGLGGWTGRPGVEVVAGLAFGWVCRGECLGRWEGEPDPHQRDEQRETCEWGVVSGELLDGSVDDDGTWVVLG